MSNLTRLAIATALMLVLGAVAIRLSYRGAGNDAEAALLTPAAGSTTDQAIKDLQQRLTVLTNDPDTLDQLGFAYLQKVRETGDSSLFSSAENTFHESLAQRAGGQDALVGLSSVALSRHDFAGALDLAQQAVDAGPAMPDAYGALGDAQMELGRYDDAVRSFQTMVNLRPDLSSYVRVSYAREVHGDIDGAIAAMKLAVEAGGIKGENVAWTHFQLGNLYFNRGDIDGADQQYVASLEAFPGYVHGVAGRARVAAARGDYGTAEGLYQQAVNRMPIVQYVVALGDVYTADGKRDEAKHQYDLVGAINQLYKSNGVNTDLEIALFYADHDRNLDEAVSQAQSVYSSSPSIPSADVLAWSLYKSGDLAGAEGHIQEALRLGSKDASIHYHAGMIYKALGDNDHARQELKTALSLNPNFSPLQAPIAQRALSELGG